MPSARINWNEIYDSPDVVKQVEIEIEKGYWKESKLDLLTGRGKNRAIRTYNIDTLDPFIPRLKDKLRGDGVKGNTDIDANLDEFEVHSYTIYPEVIANGIKSEIKQYNKIKRVDFAKEASDSLKEWVKERIQAYTFASAVNNFTNIVASKSNGFHDTTDAKSVKEACGKIQKGDVLNVKAVRQAINMAKNGIRYDGSATFPIAPLQVDMKTESGISFYHETYVLFVDANQANQLKNDPEWGEMQKQAGERGKANNIFTGIIGTIDNCAVIDMGTWNEFNIGLPTSHFEQTKFANFVTNAKSIMTLGDYSGKSEQETCLGCLLGASAICVAMNEMPKLLLDDADFHRKDMVAIEKVFGLGKAVYNSHKKNSLSPYNGQDFGIIGVISSKD
ncbi:DUF4043 family protein [Campylobacter curvus]|uniref:phage capsid family protein n=1 Tax=Campylobacter curvus TaxID=200 RepID=UPI00146FF6DD|nr:DUF4043 family protein [Campylobacter curvus]